MKYGPGISKRYLSVSVRKVSDKMYVWYKKQIYVRKALIGKKEASTPAISLYQLRFGCITRLAWSLSTR
jgi:hypothetical protein